jgi:YaiO family outer membrane protein
MSFVRRAAQPNRNRILLSPQLGCSLLPHTPVTLRREIKSLDSRKISRLSVTKITQITLVSSLFFFAISTVSAATMEEGLAFKKAEKLPAAAQVFKQIIKDNPNNGEAIEQLAIVTGWMGDHTGALALWDQAIAVAPTSGLPKVGRARVLYWLSRLDDAQIAIDQAIVVVKNDPETFELAGDIARARKDYSSAHRYYQEALRLNPQATARAQVEAKAAGLNLPLLWRIDLGAMFDDYHPANSTVVQRGHEQTGYAQLGRRINKDLTVAGGAEYSHQFGLVDWRFNGEAYWAVRDDVMLNVRGAVTPEAEVLSNWDALIGAEWQAYETATGLISIKTSDYDAESIVTFAPGVRVGSTITAEARIFYTISDVNPNTRAGMVKFSTRVAERWQPYVLGSYGEENQPPVGVAKTASVAAGTSVTLTRAWSLRLDSLYEWRENIHQRYSLGGGITYRF